MSLKPGDTVRIKPDALAASGLPEGLLAEWRDRLFTVDRCEADVVQASAPPHHHVRLYRDMVYLDAALDNAAPAPDTAPRMGLLPVLPKEASGSPAAGLSHRQADGVSDDPK